MDPNTTGLCIFFQVVDLEGNSIMIRRFLGKQQALEIFLDFSQYFYILEISQGFWE